MNIQSMDLNLLIALDVLLEEKNISVAAEKMGITQPAMSNTLARIRKTFNDDILVKVGKGMDLTPRARSLQAPLKSILQDVQSKILQDEVFDPHVDPCHFRLAFHDYEQLVIYSRLFPKLLTDFPKITLEHLSPKSMHPAEDLAQGVIDFATGPLIKDRSGIMRKKLFSDRFACLADRRNSKLKNSRLTVNKYAEMEHIFIAPHGGMSGHADEMLRSKGLQRTVRLSISEFTMAPWLILGTDLLVTIPERAAIIFSEQHKDLEIHNCPIRLDPFHIYLSWHERTANSAPHQWLKDLISI